MAAHDYDKLTSDEVREYYRAVAKLLLYSFIDQL